MADTDFHDRVLKNGGDKFIAVAPQLTRSIPSALLAQVKHDENDHLKAIIDGASSAPTLAGLLEALVTQPDDTKAAQRKVGALAQAMKVPEMAAILKGYYKIAQLTHRGEVIPNVLVPPAHLMAKTSSAALPAEPVDLKALGVPEEITPLAVMPRYSSGVKYKPRERVVAPDAQATPATPPADDEGVLRGVNLAALSDGPGERVPKIVDSTREFVRPKRDAEGRRL